jgi:hypothetical protein
MTITTITYGDGGFDESQPDNNVVDISQSPTVVDPAQEARDSAMTKLAALGLTEEEINAIIGGN